MRVTVSFKPEERALADKVKQFLYLNFPKGRVKMTREPNKHGNYLIYYQYYKNKRASTAGDSRQA